MRRFKDVCFALFDDCCQNRAFFPEGQVVEMRGVDSLSTSSTATFREMSVAFKGRGSPLRTKFRLFFSMVILDLVG
jgi:hypothetical protein